MPMRAARMCSRCHVTALPGSSRCAAHKAEPTRQRNGLRPMYKCKTWRITRLLIIARDVQCTMMENGTRCPRLSTDAHHIVEAQQWLAQGGNFYDLSNLAGLCHAHHSSHTAKEQGFAVRN